jgi:hypothetical protein
MLNAGMTEQNITLLVHTETGIFFGILALPSTMRLFDFINLPARFLNLTGKEMSDETDAASNLNELHINKNAVKILTTVVEDEGRGAATTRKVYQFVQKKPVAVMIYMTNYEVTGNLHSLDDLPLSNVLEKDVPFLPCTEVNIRNIRSNKSWHADFAALNKNNISIIEKVDNTIA